MALLEIHELDAGYDATQILWGVNMRVEEGSITVLLGGNGAGKTTTLHAVAGTVKPMRGRVIFGGRDITGLPPYKRVEMGIALVPQGRGLWPHLTVREHLELGAYTERARRMFEDNLRTVYSLFPRLKEREKQLAGTLSGGEQQMLAIARAMMSSPKLLMMDEPSQGLAPKVVLEVFRVIEKLNRKVGLTILFTEHNVHMALKVADYGYVIERGRIVLEGRSDKLEQEEMIRRVYKAISPHLRV